MRDTIAPIERQRASSANMIYTYYNNLLEPNWCHIGSGRQWWRGSARMYRGGTQGDCMQRCLRDSSCRGIQYYRRGNCARAHAHSLTVQPVRRLSLFPL